MTDFPGANAALSDAVYALVGAPLDVSATFQPGARFGPGRIRQFAQPFDGYDRRTGSNVSDLVTDSGDVEPWNDVAEYLDFLEGELSSHHESGRVPLLMGGEHTVTVAGIRAADPDVFVCLDAHLDLYDAYAGNELSHATVTHHALEVANEAIVIGARTGSETEWDRAGEEDISVVSPEEATSWTPSFSGDVYLSIDIDAADPAYAPGTGTPVPFGMDSRVMRNVVHSVAPHAIGFDVVEVTDQDDGQSAGLAGKLLQEFVFSHADA